MKGIAKRDIRLIIGEEQDYIYTFTKGVGYPCIFRNHDAVRILDNNEEEAIVSCEYFNENFELRV